MTARHKSRYSNGNARRKLRARLKAEGRPCAICGGLIDYDLSAGNPWAFEVDEKLPFSLGGSAIDYDNVQPAHRRCNQLKGNKLGVHISINSKTRKEQKINHVKKLEACKSVSKW